MKIKKEMKRFRGISPSSTINAYQFLALFYIKGDKPLSEQNPNILRIFHDGLKEAVSLHQLEYKKPVSFPLSYYEFRRDKFFLWFAKSGMADFFLKSGIIIPPIVAKEITHYLKQPEPQKKGNAPAKPHSQRALEKLIWNAVKPVLEKYLIDKAYTLTDLKKESEFLQAVQGVTAFFSKEDKLKVEGYPSDSVLQRAAAKFRSLKKIRHKNAIKD